MRRGSENLLAFIGLLALLLSGCATSYQNRGLSGGYSEKRISDSVYVVTFSGNSLASRDRIYDFFLYRCAELTLSQGYALFETRRPGQSTQRAAELPRASPAVYHGDEGAHASNASYFLVPFPMIPEGPSYTFRANVLMYPAPLAPEVIWALDAQKIHDGLKPFVQSEHDQLAPDHNALFLSALRAHEVVRIGDERAHSAATPLAGDRGLAPFQNPRSVAEISDTLGRVGMIPYLTAFHEYRELYGADASGGEVALDFTVRSNGRAANIHVASSSFADTDFVALVQYVVSRTDFGARDAADTDVKNFAIGFQPL